MAGRSVGRIEVTVDADTSRLKAQIVRAGKEAGEAGGEAIEEGLSDIEGKELVTRLRTMREGIAAALKGEDERYDHEATFPYEHVALMTQAMTDGFALEKLLEGDAIPDQLYGTMLMVFFAGLEALSSAQAAAGANEPA